MAGPLRKNVHPSVAIAIVLVVVGGALAFVQARRAPAPWVPAVPATSREQEPAFEVDAIAISSGGHKTTGRLRYTVDAVLQGGTLRALRYRAVQVTVAADSALVADAESAGFTVTLSLARRGGTAEIHLGDAEDRVALGLQGWERWDEREPKAFTGCADGDLVPDHVSLLTRAFEHPPVPVGATVVSLRDSVTFPFAGEAEMTAGSTTHGSVAAGGTLGVESRGYGLKDIDGSIAWMRTVAATREPEALGATLETFGALPHGAFRAGENVSVKDATGVSFECRTTFSANELKGFEPAVVRVAKAKRARTDPGVKVVGRRWTSESAAPSRIEVDLDPPLLPGDANRAARVAGLTKILDESLDPNQAVAAALLVGDEGLVEARVALERCLADPTEASEVLENAVASLARLKRAESFGPLVAALEGSRDGIRFESVALALTAIDPARAEKWLDKVAVGNDAKKADEARRFLEERAKKRR